MSGPELFFLLASAYLHDIGMVDFPELREDQSNAEAGGTRWPELIRSKHHERSEKSILSVWSELGLEDGHQAGIVGRICRGHRREDLRDQTMFESTRVYRNAVVNMPLLASFLKLADELDITFERTPAVLYELLPPTGKKSKVEWQKHLSVAGVAIAPGVL
jgi:hypothetical protein